MSQILDMYARLEDYFLRDTDEDALGRWLLRASGEQMVYQEPVFQDLARTAAMLTQTAGTREPRRMRPGWEEELLGTSLSHYVGIAQLLWASAISCGGRFYPASLEAPGAERICAEIPATTITSVAEEHFVIDAAAFRADNDRARMTTDPLLRRFEYNPLRGKPLVRGYDAELLAPVSQLLWAKASPLGIYYTGVAHFGNAFAQDLGDLFEAYVGRQLGLLANATVLPEIAYGRERALSVDWIVITDDLVLLVEVKSVRPTWHLRLASERRVDEVKRMLGHAYEQIDNTAALIAGRQKEFAEVPTDRPVHGLIVTMEPFHIVNAPVQRPQLPATAVPVTACSISELENLVTITDAPVGRLLLERAADAQRSTYNLREALTGHAHDRNPVLDAGWDSYPWRHAAAEQVPSEPAGTGL
ncbi:nuclease-related domain-containing protein [Streptomyces sp. 039-1]|uniref:nuclease-related domain-containing protein n=1 Tax=Streptomyces sp. 039-1 TaxID=2789263 RepID=UPI0039F628D4